MQGMEAASSAGPLFVGQRGALVVWFICSHDGSFGVQCLWPPGQLDEALRAYLDFVERPGPARDPSATLPPTDRRPAAGGLQELVPVVAAVPPDPKPARPPDRAASKGCPGSPLLPGTIAHDPERDRPIEQL